MPQIFKRKSTLIFGAPLVALIVMTLLGSFSQSHFICEWMSHPRIAYAIGFGIIMLSTLILRKKWMALTSGVFLAVIAAQLIPYFIDSKQETSPESAPHLTLLQLNTWGHRNQNHEALYKRINELKPDVLIFSEVDEKWKAEFEQRLIEYPYARVQASSDGVALYSRLPLDNVVVKFAGPTKRPRIEADVKVGDRSVFVVASHPIVPKWLQVRNAEFDDIASDVRRSHAPAIVAGDLNCTPFSFYFQKFLKDSGLRDSQVGFGVQPSWPSEFPFVPVLPLDHYLISDGLVNLNRTTLPFIGSDHLPVYTELAVTGKNQIASRKETALSLQ